MMETKIKFLVLKFGGRFETEVVEALDRVDEKLLAQEPEMTGRSYD